MAGRSSRSFSACRTRFLASAYDDTRCGEFRREGDEVERLLLRGVLPSSGTDETAGPEDALGAPDDRKESDV